MNNLELIKNTVKDIKNMKDDDEAAHSTEDGLREAVLKDIASDAYTREECREFAKEALKTSEIEFARWCA